ncbi:17992_t:CDS:2 [Funneliformis geosporum]|uniref:17553_t:CDS:1 n=1 Tax=Funneliformis geosporum TaxID=1117311 RepID=A0A9W4WKC4_9GLOM|nr:17553_t:CDS:2 [Funneliformis geosporum]CAI2168212.1 17992_t:CDS:2 [Funneliformis geosporum]
MNVTKTKNQSVKDSPLEEQDYKNFVDETSKNQINENDYYSPDDDDSDSEEGRALTIKHSICLTTPEKFVSWWNENHPDCQITIDSLEEWTYREDEDPSTYNIHWREHGD